VNIHLVGRVTDPRPGLSVVYLLEAGRVGEANLRGRPVLGFAALVQPAGLQELACPRMFLNGTNPFAVINQGCKSPFLRK